MTVTAGSVDAAAAATGARYERQIAPPRGELDREEVRVVNRPEVEIV